MSNDEMIGRFARNRIETISIIEAVNLTNRTHRTIQYWVRDNKVKSVLFGCKRYLDKSDVLKMVS